MLRLSKKRIMIGAALLLVGVVAFFWAATAPAGSRMALEKTKGASALPGVILPEGDLSVKIAPEREGSASTKSSNSYGLPTVTGAPATSELGGTLAKAQVRVGAKEYSLEPNALGLFPRVLMSANATAQVSVVYPEGSPADLLVLQAEDGGWIDQGATVKQGRLNQEKRISFEFKTSREEGVYRVTLRKGTDQKHFDFWVGPEPALQKGI